MKVTISYSPDTEAQAAKYIARAVAAIMGPHRRHQVEDKPPKARIYLTSKPQ